MRNIRWFVATLLLAGCLDDPANPGNTSADVSTDLAANDGGGDATGGDATFDGTTTDASVDAPGPDGTVTDAPAPDGVADGIADSVTDVPQKPPCERLCDVVEACDFYTVLEIGTDRSSCLAGCQSALAEQPWLSGVAECAEAAQAASCDVAAMEECSEAYTNFSCEELCAEAYDGACDATDAFLTVWPTADDCEAACEATEDDQRLNLGACLNVIDCGDPTPCLGVTPGTTPECEAACSALGEVCADAFAAAGESAPGGFTDPMCAHFCSVVGQLVGTGTPADAAGCIQSWDTCPYLGPGEPGNELRDAFLACALTPTAECTTTCSTLTGCNAFEDPEEAAACPLQCSYTLVEDPGDVDAVVDCVAANSTSCDIVTACLPGVANTPCVGACVTTSACGPVDIPTCIASCEGALTSDASGLGEVVCDAIAGCDVDCSGAADPTLAECVTACAGSSACGGFTDGCAEACSGSLAALGVSPTEDLAICVLDHLGDGCEIQPEIDDCLDEGP